MRTVIFLSLTLALPGCSKGAHVDTFHRDMVKYACYYSDSIWRQDRRIAVCDNEKECNDICAKLPNPS